MTLNPIKCVVAMGMVLLGWGVAGEAYAAKCVQSGGTEAGCTLAPVVWKKSTDSAHPNRYQTLDQAITGVGYYLKTASCTACDLGVLWSPVPGQTSYVYTHPDEVLADSYISWVVYIWGKEYKPNGEFARYHFSTPIAGIIQQEPSCPGRYAALEAGTDGIKRWYCKPNKAPLSRTENIIEGFSGLDTTLEGCTTGCNPVNLVTGTKYDEQTDYKNNSPFPIVWKRTYNSRKEGWTFNYSQRIDASFEGTTPRVSLTRPDGSILLLKTTALSTTSASSVWTLDMGANQSWRGTLTDVRNSSGQLTGWNYKNLHNEIEHFDATGKLRSIQSAQGHQLVMHYTNERLSSITDDFGRSLTLNYSVASVSGAYTFNDPDSPDPLNPVTLTDTFDYFPTANDSNRANLIASVTDGTQTVQYTYQDVKTSTVYYANILTVTGTDGGVVSYTYDTYGRMTSITDQNNDLFATYTYDTYNRVLTSSHGASKDPITYTYGTTYTRVKDGNNNQAEFNISEATTKKFNKTSGSNVPCTKCGGTKAKNIVYNDFGDPLTVTDFDNNITTYTYDTARGLPLTVTQASGTPLARTITYTWSPTIRKPLTVVEPVVVNGATHTKTTTFVYNSFGEPTSMTVSLSNGEPSRVWTYTYGTNKLLATQTDPNGMVTQFVYDTQGNLTEKTIAFGTSKAQTTILGGYSPKGLVGWIQDENGLTVRLTRNNRDQIVKIERGIPSASGVWAAGGTWETQSVSYTAFGSVETIVSPNGTQQTYVYDTARRVTSIVEKNASNAQTSKIVYTYDGANNVIKQELFDGSNTLVGTQSQTFDTVNRVKTQLDGQSNSTSFEYTNENNLKKLTTPLANQTQYAFDALQRQTTVTDALNKQFVVAYDVQDQVVSATDAMSKTTTYSYNGFGDITQIASPDRGTWNFTYNAFGQRTTTTDPRGVVATTVYDILSRPTSVVYNGTAATGSALDNTNISYTFSYDGCTNGSGRLCSFADNTGTTTYTYDVWGRPLSRSWVGKTGTVAAGATLSTSYTYNSAGQMISTTYPSGKVVEVGYSSGLPVSLDYGSQQVLGNAQWNAWGTVKKWTWAATGIPSGAKQVSFNYDLDGQAQSIVDMDTRNYVWDADERIVAIDDPVDPTNSQLYSYNKVNNITQVDIGSWVSPIDYTYDFNGNKTSKLSANSGYSLGVGLTNNRIAKKTMVNGGVNGAEYVFTYDAMGSLIDDGQGSSYAFDTIGNMSSSFSGIHSSHYAYNALNQRMWKTTSSGVEVYAYDEAGRRIGSYFVNASHPNSIETQEELLYWDNWRLVGSVRPDPALGMASPIVYPVLTDHLGSPRKVLDPTTGYTRWDWDAKEPFGMQAPNENPSSTGLFVFNARFPGQWFDKETGFYHNGFRYYDPSLGRYTQSDLLGLEAGWNTYAYVASNPLGGIDPFGLKEGDREVCTFFMCATLRPITLRTNEGKRYRAYQYIDGFGFAKGYSQNCFSYAMNFEDGVWLDNPRQMIRDNYVRVPNENEADIVVFYNSNNIPVHASRVNQNGMNTGKNGSIMWIGRDPKFLHTIKGNTPIYYKERY